MTDLEKLRHSTAHVLATAILRLWPETQFAAGPPVEGGFYYDLELEHHITPKDFPHIEKEMQTVIAENQPFERKVVSRSDALTLGQAGRLAALSNRTQPSKFKIDILREISEGEIITLYQNGDFVDLCAGPHISSTGKIAAFKLTHLASSFYRGDEKNPQLQRIYGIAFPTQQEMDAHFALLEEAKKLDHRKLGKEMQLFHIDEAVGQGLILWCPAGAIIREELQNFLTKELRQQGYQQVFTPHIARVDLFRTSGHFPYYAESQFPPLIEPEFLHSLAKDHCSCAELANRIREGKMEGFLLKPMNCPMHIQIFASQPRSYRQLPLRFAEFGTVYRWEQSGELSGMTRVRGFTQDDAHLFCTEQQVEEEIQNCLRLVNKVLKTFRMEDYRVRLGLRDPSSSKYVGSEENWNHAEGACRQAVKALAIPSTEEIGEAAFYGPKIDFVVKDVLGREWQLGTVQVDFNLPIRFGLSYIGSDGRAHVPVMIHRAPFGSFERFVGLLIEHFRGNFPLWLSPEQVRVLPVSEKFAEFAQTIVHFLSRISLRVVTDKSSEKIGAKIRLAQLEKVPYMLIVGAREQASGQVSVRSRRGGQEGTVSIDEFLRRIQIEIESREP